MKRILLFFFSVMHFSSCMKTDVYTITAESNDTALGTVTGGGGYIEGSTAVLTAIPNPGCKFSHWTNNYGSANPLKIIVKRDVSITAVFKSNANVVINIPGTYRPEYFKCELDVSSKKMFFVSTLNASSSDYMVHIEFSWDESIRAGIFLGHSNVDFASIEIPNGWGGYYEEIDLSASTITFGNPFLWYKFNSSITVGGISLGDLLAKDVTLMITSIDLNNRLVSFVAEATVVDIVRCVETNKNWEEAETTNLKVEATDIPLIVY